MKSEAIKIGFIFNQSFFLGGGEHSLFLLIESLKNSDFNPVGIVPDQGEITEKLERHGIPYRICPLSSLRRGTGKYFFRDIETLRNAFKDHNIKIIHANGSRACLYGGIAGRMLGIPVIWHVRETIRGYFLYDALLGMMANRIVCVSKAVVRKRFERFGVLLRGKISVAYNGVDPYKFQIDISRRGLIRNRFGIAGDVLISMIGNFIPRKGHEFLVKGLSEAYKLNPNNRLKLLCIGRIVDSDYYNRIVNLAKNRGVEKRVMFLDYTTDMAGIFSATDIYVLPSRSEGFSRSLLEAMVMGLPVIATNINEIAEAVEDQIGGILIDYGDIAAMAKAILLLYQDPDLRLRMGRENKDRVLRYFTSDIHTRAIENIYSGILSRRKGDETSQYFN